MCIGAHMKPCTEMKTNVNYKESVDKCQQNDIICFKAFLNKPMDDMSTNSRNRDVKKRASESIMYQKFWVMTAFKSTKWKRRSKWKCKKKTRERIIINVKCTQINAKNGKRAKQSAFPRARSYTHTHRQYAMLKVKAAVFISPLCHLGLCTYIYALCVCVQCENSFMIWVTAVVKMTVVIICRQKYSVKLRLLERNFIYGFKFLNSYRRSVLMRACELILLLTHLDSSFQILTSILIWY